MENDPGKVNSPARLVDIVGLISGEFGTARSTVRQQMALGSIEIAETMNSAPNEWSGDKFFIPHHVIDGKVIAVIGPERQWRMTYKPYDEA